MGSGTAKAAKGIFSRSLSESVQCCFAVANFGRLCDNGTQACSKIARAEFSDNSRPFIESSAIEAAALKRAWCARKAKYIAETNPTLAMSASAHKDS